MASSAKKSAPKKRPAKKTTKDTKSTQQAKKQMWAVVLFALGLLFGAITFIKGEKFWLGLHNFFFGIFGWSVYFLAPLIIYIAVIAALDKPLSSIKAKLWQAVTLIIMIAGAIQIFGNGLPEEESIAKTIAALYDGGKNLSGGGVASAIFALPLISLFAKTGAGIIISLAIFVFVMLITGSSLISLYKMATKPVKNLEEDYIGLVDNFAGKKPSKRQKPAKPEKNIAPVPPLPPRFDIDVDIADDSEPEDFAVSEAVENTPPVPEGDFLPTGEEILPGHPVITENGGQNAADDNSLARLLTAINADKPVEYISADEFPQRSAPPPEEPEPEPEVIQDETTHPLDDDILSVINSFLSEDYDDAIAADLPDEPELNLIEPMDEPPENPEYEEISLTYDIPIIPKVYRHPPIGILNLSKAVSGEDVTEELKTNAQTLVDTLKSFGVQTRITDICRGPAVTRYELQPSAGVKISKITGLSDDIALNLATAGIRIEAPIPNKAAVGIEVPNKIVSVVSIRDIIDSDEFGSSNSSLSAALGKDIAGNVTLADIGKMPHVLIAGSTGSGKSVCINSIIISLLYKSSPGDVKLLMIDPKVVELGVYNGIPHLLIPVVTDPKKAAGALGWAVTEMLNRYKTFAEHSVRDLTGYNKLAETRPELAKMPKIVIIIDELADLMMAAPNEVEDSICRLAQMARAAGMHLVIATQRPSVDVITGVIKANIPSRIAFAVSSQVDSRTILDMGGAEKLLGRGDMLFSPVGSSKPVRIQGCFVTDAEVEKVVNFIKEGEDATYDQNIVEEIDRHVIPEKGSKDSGGGFDDEDDMLPNAIECVVEAGQASTSQLQRRLKLGYARAARIIDQLEERGIVGPFEGSKPRQVLISKDRWYEMKLNGVLAAKQDNSNNNTD